jgi:hypothetical protein
MMDTRLCPICKHPLPEGKDAARFRPFCSRRCANVDLGRWLKGGYAIPAVETDDETERETGANAAEDGKGNTGPARH